jgi:hypothetical protein
MSKAKKEFNPSEKIVAIQSEICGLKKDTNNPFFKSKYINLGSIVNAIKPVLHKNDCYSTHKVGLDDSYRPSLTSEICYKDGTVLLSCTSPLPVKDVNDPQKLGSAITYMRRYNLTALLEIEEDDDDGNTANQPATKQNQFQKVANAANGEMEATQRKAAEDNFKRIKQSLEDCGSVEELESIIEKDKTAINAMKKYNSDLFAKLRMCKEDMIKILDPEGED